MKILAIDDQPDNLTALKAVVKDALPEATVLTALTGREGIALAAAEDPDVILLDIVMPNMDGFEVCRQLKADVHLRLIPVVFVTAQTERASRLQALETGAEAFLAKPLDAHEVTAQIRVMVKIKAANQAQLLEKERLAALVSERTAQLERELSERRQAMAELEQSRQKMEHNQTAILNLLEDLKSENNARKQTEAKLRESEYFLTRSQAVSRLGSYKFHIPSGTWICSPELDVIFGIGPDHPKTIESWLQLVVPEQREKMRRHLLEEVVAQRGRFDREYRIRRHDDGQERWVFGLGELEYDPQGNPLQMIGTIQDITDRKRIEQRIADALSFNQTVIRNVPVGLVVFKASGECVSVNDAMAGIIGITKEEVLQQNFRQLESWKHSGMLDAAEVALAKQETQRLEGHQTSNHGREAWLLCRFVPFNYANEPHLLLTVNDLTERKKAEEVLRLANQRMTLHVEHTPLAVIEFDLNGRVREWNPSAVKIFGFTREEAIGQYWRFMVPEAEWGQVDGVWENLITLRGGSRSTNTNRTKDGRTINCEWFNTILVDADGRVIGVTSLVQDVTEQKQAEERIRLHLQQTLIAAIEFDAELRFTSWNPAAERIFGYTAAEALGQHTNIIIPENARFQIDELMHKVVTQRVVAQSTNENVTKSGKLITCEWYNSPLVAADGTATGMTSFAVDITERKRAEQALNQEHILLRALIDHIPDYIYVRDLSNRFIVANESFARFMGVAGPSALIGKSDADYYPPEMAADFGRTDHDVIAGHPIFNKERVLRFPNGQELVVLNTKVPFTNDQGEVVGLIGVGRDITERKQAEEVLRESQALYSSFVEQLPAATFRKNREGRYVMVNPRFCRLKGLTAEEFLGKTAAEVAALQISRQTEEGQATKYATQGDVIHERIMRTGEIVEQEEEYPDPAGGKMYMQSVRIPVFGADGSVVGTQGILLDITTRKEAELALRESHTFNESLLQTITFGIDIVDDEGRILFMNAALEKAAGTAALGKRCWELYRDDKQQCANCPLNEPINIGETKSIESTGCLGGKIFEIAHTGMTYRGRKAVLEVFYDITSRKRAEESNIRLAAAIEQAVEAVMITDAAGKILYVNPAFEKITGYTRQKAIGQNPRILKSGKHDAGFYQNIWTVLARGDVWQGRFTNKRKDGSLYEEEATISSIRDAAGRIINFVSVKRDITERLKNERIAWRSQRLESIGTLAGGVAHDLNNALTPIMMGVQLLKLQYPEESQILDTFQTSAKRAADMVRQLLTFAKGTEGERFAVQPGRLIRELENMIKVSFPKNIQLVIRCDKELPTVMGDATQLHQVLLNLCVNARDAMPGGGTLTLEAQRMEVDATHARTIPDAKPGSYLVFRVRDTGTGIPPEILDRIFDPFFTTKSPDKGTGLGLSTVLGIVKSHGGFIQVDSHPGEGSTFTAYLPADRTGSDTEHLTKTAAEFRGQGELILYVDDEPSLRDITRAVLRRLNFKPLTANNGSDGLIKVAENRTELRAIITDLQMPHMDGLEFVGALRQMLPDIPVLVVSGRMDEDVTAQFKALGVTTQLDKPFTESQLAAMLQTLLAPK